MTKPVARDAIYRRLRFSAEIIETCVRWYFTYRLSYRHLVAMMAERDVVVSHTTIMRWVLRYTSEYERRWDRFASPPCRSSRMDETAVSVRGGRHLIRPQSKSRDWMSFPTEAREQTLKLLARFQRHPRGARLAAQEVRDEGEDPAAASCAQAMLYVPGRRAL
jgi:hypothetical protein